MRSAQPSRRGTAIPARSLVPAVVALAAVLATVLVIGCAPSGDATATPGASGIGGSPGTGGETPRPTVWPTLVVESSIALGAADGDFVTMTNDISAALDQGDPAELLDVINRALEFLTENEKNIARLQAYDHTKSVGDRLAPAYASMIEGATGIRDGLTSGDADAIEAGFATFIDGNTAYQAVRSELGDLADQAIFMKRQLLR